MLKVTLHGLLVGVQIDAVLLESNLAPERKLSIYIDTSNSPTGGFITPSQTKITLSQIHKGTYTKLCMQYYMNCYATIRNNEMYASQHEDNFKV